MLMSSAGWATDAHSKTLSATSTYPAAKVQPVSRPHSTRLTPEARNAITIENDENKWGIEDSLELADDLRTRS